MLKTITIDDIRAAARRIQPHLHRTPIFESHLLNDWLGHRVLFKCEMFQKIGAYKARGALNMLLKMQEEGRLPEKIAAFSSGNHAQAVAWGCSKLGIKPTIFVPANSSAIKRSAAESYGAEVIIASTRAEAERRAALAEEAGATLIPPYDHDDIIAGQGTVTLEALEDAKTRVDAVFTPVGGGGLISGATIVAKSFSRGQESEPALSVRSTKPFAEQGGEAGAIQEIKVFAGEPIQANDAAQSLRDGKIFRFDQAPETIADGARTLGISERTFQYIKQCDGIFEITEQEIMYWTQWIMHLLKVTCEPSSALSMCAAFRWLEAQTETKTAMVILSGGNISDESYRQIWHKNYLETIPRLQPKP